MDKIEALKEMVESLRYKALSNKGTFRDHQDNYNNHVDQILAMIDAQGKQPELEGYLHDIERLGVLVVDRINPNETIAGCVVRLLKNQGKLAEGGYRAGFTPCYVTIYDSTEKTLLSFKRSEGRDEQAMYIASLLNSQGAEIKRLGDANEKFENQEEIIQHLTTAVGNLRDKLTTAQAKVEEFKLLLYSSDMKPTDRLMDKNDKLTAEVASLREALGFYADKDNWADDWMTNGTFNGIHPRDCDRQGGKVARQALSGSDNAESDPQDNSGECGGAYAEELNKAIDSEKIPMTDSSELDNSGGEG